MRQMLNPASGARLVGRESHRAQKHVTHNRRGMQMEFIDWARLALAGLLLGAIGLLLYTFWTALRDSDYDH